MPWGTSSWSSPLTRRTIARRSPGQEVGVAHVLEHFSRARTEEPRARERTVRRPRREIPPSERQEHVSGLRHGEHVAVREIEQLRLRSVRARDEYLRRGAVPARPVDDRFLVGREPRRANDAAIERQPRHGGRLPGAARGQRAPEDECSRDRGDDCRGDCEAAPWSRRRRRRLPARRTDRAERQRIEREGQIARRLEPLAGFLFEAALDDALERGWHGEVRSRRAAPGLP